MKAVFWTRFERGHLPKSDWRETNLAEAISNGARLCGDEISIHQIENDGPPQVIDCDLVLSIGVKRRDLFRAYNAAGIPFAYFDKGYIRTRATEWMEYWRVTVNGHQPLTYVETAKHDGERASKMELTLSPWREPRGDCILVDGASGKHHYFHADETLKHEDLNEHAHQVAVDLCQRVRKLAPKRTIIYRPKPSWKAARPIDGCEFSQGKDNKPALRRSHCVVTYQSNLCFDAVLFGVPSIILGCGIARPISSIDLTELENPRLASLDERQQWLNNVAWTQFKPSEFPTKTPWRTIRDMVEVTPIDA